MQAHLMKEDLNDLVELVVDDAIEASRAANGRVSVKFIHATLRKYGVPEGTYFSLTKELVLDAGCKIS